MGCELRLGGKWYLYRNRRVSGKPVKEYLAAQGDWGAVMAHDRGRRQRKVRSLLGKERQRTRKRIDGLVAATAGANTELRAVARGTSRQTGQTPRRVRSAAPGRHLRQGDPQPRPSHCGRT